MLNGSALLGSESVIPVLILAPLLILWGAFLAWAAYTDPGGWFTSWYEGNKGERSGFFAISRNSIDFRGWGFGIGIVFFVAGVASLVWALVTV